MTQSEILQKAAHSLEVIYHNYKERGVLSIYLLGSITTEDYNSITSDIDAMAIVSDSTHQDVVDEINTILEHIKSIQNFHLNIIYLSELNGGEARSRPAKISGIRMLLMGFPNWRYVAGKQFERSDFSTADYSLDEAITHEKQEALTLQLPLLEKDPTNKGAAKYLVKCCIYVLYFLSQKQGGAYPFSYSAVFDKNQQLAILPILKEARERHYDPNFVSSHSGEISTFLTSVL